MGQLRVFLRRERAGLGVIFLVWGLAALGAAALEPVHCEARLHEERVLADVTLNGLLTPELSRLVKLGLSGNIHVQVSLIHHRPFWFDSVEQTVSVDRTLGYSRSGKSFTLEGRAVPHPETLTLERFALGAPGAVAAGYRVEVKVRLQVVTSSSLERVVDWVRPDGERGDVPSKIVDSVVNDLARSEVGQCEVRTGRVEE